MSYFWAKFNFDYFAFLHLISLMKFILKVLSKEWPKRAPWSKIVPQEKHKKVPNYFCQHILTSKDSDDPIPQYRHHT